MLRCGRSSVLTFLIFFRLPAYYRQLKKYHIAHHYTDHESGFGVTSPFWDVVFGTEFSDPTPGGKAGKAA